MNRTTSLMTNSIKTTVVGSYPIPEWLKTSPNPQTLRDAMRLVLDTQEQAVGFLEDGGPRLLIPGLLFRLVCFLEPHKSGWT